MLVARQTISIRKLVMRKSLKLNNKKHRISRLNTEKTNLKKKLNCLVNKTLIPSKVNNSLLNEIKNVYFRLQAIDFHILKLKLERLINNV